MKATASTVLLVLVFAGHSRPVSSCSCLEKKPIAFYFESAKAVFAGTPTLVRLDQAPAGKQEPLAGRMISRTMIEFHIEKWWKGGESSTAIVSTGMGGGDCGSDFRVGARYIVFASESGDGLYTSICSGNLYFNTASREIDKLNRLSNSGKEQK